MTELHTHETVFEHRRGTGYAEYVYRFRVPGGWMYIYSVAESGWFSKKGWLTSSFVPDPDSK
jgi:hypothetical protein